jgi:hypothetical protein
MKKQNWKYAVTGRLVATACVAGLLLLAVSAQASLGKALLKFDNFANGSAITNGYGDLSWANFYALDAVNYSLNPSGYEAGIMSPNNVLYNGGSSPAAIYSDKYAFILNSAYLTGAWNDNLQVQIKGYFLKKLVFSRTIILSATQPTLVKFPNKLVTEVDFYSSGGTDHAAYSGSGEHFATDNVSVTVYPIPVQPITPKIEE